ncbi:MAG: hypothetical protein CMB49_05065 [Euryarchaeota archaeon]|nr:hypothetical protein [Euryarchaeota archaeon]
MEEVSMEILRSRLMLAQSTHNQQDEMTVLADIAHRLLREEMYDEGRHMLEQSLDIARSLDDDMGLIVAHWGLADTAHLCGDAEEELLQLSQVVAAHLQAGIRVPEQLTERLSVLTG